MGVRRHPKERREIKDVTSQEDKQSRKQVTSTLMIPSKTCF
jgi:hypothetical protein